MVTSTVLLSHFGQKVTLTLTDCNWCMDLCETKDLLPCVMKCKSTGSLVATF